MYGKLTKYLRSLHDIYPKIKKIRVLHDICPKYIFLVFYFFFGGGAGGKYPFLPPPLFPTPVTIPGQKRRNDRHYRTSTREWQLTDRFSYFTEYRTISRYNRLYGTSLPTTGRACRRCGAAWRWQSEPSGAAADYSLQCYWGRGRRNRPANAICRTSARNNIALTGTIRGVECTNITSANRFHSIPVLLGASFNIVVGLCNDIRNLYSTCKSR